jgi:uncharacterized protein (TIGR03437 family)
MLTLLLASATGMHLRAQSGPAPVATEWRRAGNLSLDRSAVVGLAGVSSGPVARVWYSASGDKIFAQAPNGRVFETSDLEQWAASSVTEIPPREPLPDFARSRPESGAKVRRSLRERVYAAGRFVYRSDDDGANWTNLTEYRGQSILGDGVADIAPSPRDADEITVATANGLWRSVDAGLTWSGLNDGFPNFPGARILETPNGVKGIRLFASANGYESGAFEWRPGERKAWREYRDETMAAEMARHERLSQAFGVRITASAVVGDAVYAGGSDGRIWASSDRGVTWRLSKLQESGPITRIVADPQDPRLALATAGARPADLDPERRGAHVLRTINGGGFWDDLTDNLPDVAATGIAFERSSGAIYASTARGVYFTAGDLTGLGRATSWRALTSQPAADVQLGMGGHQLYAAVEGEGVFAAAAPHRRGSPRLVNAADFSNRAAAPGSLLTLIGRQVTDVLAGSSRAPVLASTEERSEIQIPFDVRGPVLPLVVSSRTGPLQFGLALDTVAPSIFVDRDGAPMILDAESGVMLDSMSPARSGNRVQILSSGLGRVRPEWPAGVAAPMDAPPSVVANVRAWLDRSPVEVTRAVLAPGYIGFYLIEIELPKIVNYGPAELYIEADGRESNRVRVYIEP